MKQLIAILIIGLCLACNNHQGKKTNATQSSPNNALQQQLLDQVQEQIKQHPDSVALQLKLVYLLDSVKAYNEAITRLDTIILKDSLNQALWFVRGSICEDAKDTAQSIYSFEKAVKIYPAPEALLKLANWYAEKKMQGLLLFVQE